MTLHLEAISPALRAGADGTVCVGDTRVPLDLIVEAFQDGAAPEEIVLQYPVLELADVYAALAYYLRHRAEVDAYLAQRATAVEEKRRKAAPQMAEIRERLLARARKTD